MMMTKGVQICGHARTKKRSVVQRYGDSAVGGFEGEEDTLVNVIVC